MASGLPLKPTLWRTCRVLANRPRLRIFQLLLRRPGQSVSAVAEHLDLTLSAASQYLRSLEARGLLTARRVGRRGEFRVAPAAGGNAVSTLVTALRFTFKNDLEPVEAVFRLTTAFTHPRRIEVFR